MKTLKKSRKLKFGKLILILFSTFSFQLSAFPQTGTISVDQNHTGHRLYNIATPSDSSDVATKAYVDAHGGGGGSVSLTATSPIIVTPSPITGTGVVSLDATSKSNWDTAFTQTRQWNGGATGLVAGTGRTSLGLVIGTDVQAWDADLDAVAALSGTNTIYYRSGAATWSPVTIGSNMTFSGGTLNSTAGGSGTVTTTGSPATGNLTKFSGSTSITNGDLSGDVTTSGTLAATIAKIGSLTSNGFVKTTGGTGALSVDTSTYLTGNQNISLTGDVTGGPAATSIATTIGNSKVTYAKMQNVSANSVLLGSSASGSGAAPSEIALGTNLSMTGSTLNASGGSTSFANPTAKVGTSVVNGSATTAMRSDAAPPIDQTLDLGMTNSQTITLTDTGTANIPYPLTINHNSSGTPTTFFGTGLSLQAKSDTTNNRPLAEFAGSWGTATDASRSSFIRMRTANNTGFHGQLTFYDSGFLTNSANADAGGAYINSTLGYRFNNATPTSGTILQSNGSAFAGTSVVWPAAAPTTGQIIIASSSNWVASTPAYPNAAGTAGYTLRSDGTNFATYPQDMINSSVASQATFSTSDIYIAGSNVTVAAGDFKAKGQYHCMFDMTKSAGTGAIVITLRVGTAGSTSDAAIQTYTFGAGTAVADSGLFDVWATFRTVGSGTSAVITSVCYGRHNAATTGLFNNAQQFTVFGSPAPSSGFATNTATQIGLSFNGSTAFAGTGTIVQAQLLQ